MTISRRHFLTGLGAALGMALPVAAGARSFWLPRPGDIEPGPVFRHGVASGDPLADRVILWTRVAPNAGARHVLVQWRVARDPLFADVVRTGRALAGPDRDYTVKLDAVGLHPDTTYYYQFFAAGEQSPVGRTRTLPRGAVENVRLAVASCANLAFGFFNAYRLIAARPELNAVVHLGDYLYEYGNGTFGDGAALGRIPEPDAEILTLDDYRTRHAQYRRDPDLQECHRQHPFICIWDDHEVANDAWRDGAENHQPTTEGGWTERRRAALQAWFEWLPVRDPGGLRERSGRIFREFRFGELASLTLLDTRLHGRDQQAPPILDPVSGGLLVPPEALPQVLAQIEEPARQLLGEDQENWLYERLEASMAQGVRWRLLGQQVMMGHLRQPIPELGLAVPINTDQWDGYPAARARLLSFVRDRVIDNVVVLTGDIHSSWAQDIPLDPFDGSYDAATGRGSLAVEFVTPAVTSEGIPEAYAPQLEALLRAAPSPLKYVDLSRRGYLVLDVTPGAVQADWFHLDDILDPGAGETFAAAFWTRAGSARVEAAPAPVLARGAVADPAPAMRPAPRVIA